MSMDRGVPSGLAQRRAPLARWWRVVAFAFVLWCVPRAASGQVLEPGDEVELRIPGAKTVTLSVATDGTLDLASYGSFSVTGRTVEQAREGLRRYLAQYIKATGGVQLKLIQAGRLVLVTGKVKAPGMVRVGKNDDLWQAISKAGGPGDGADLTRVTLSRKVSGGDPVETQYNVSAYLAGARSISLPVVQSGDTVFIPSGAGLDSSPGSAFLSDDAVASKVFVLGAVARPGMYDRPKMLTALAALALAGGPTSEADLSNIRVTTTSGVRRLDVVSWLEGETKNAPQLPATGGVIVYVPAGAGEGGTDAALGRHIGVVGGVNQPGRLPVRGPVLLIDLLAMAGGANDRADLGEVEVVHRGPAFTIATTYDVEGFLEKGGLLSNVMVNPGDTVYVTTSSTTVVWQTVVGVISNLAQISAAFALFATLAQ
jgi:protein involved in polysaccharide export with SLBB domain